MALGPLTSHARKRWVSFSKTSKSENVLGTLRSAWSTIAAGIVTRPSSRIEAFDAVKTAGVEMFDTWILFGDPSLRIKGRGCSDAGVVNLDRDLYACEDTAVISVLDCNLNTDDQVVETVVVEIDSDNLEARVGEVSTRLSLRDVELLQ